MTGTAWFILLYFGCGLFIALLWVRGYIELSHNGHEQTHSLVGVLIFLAGLLIGPFVGLQQILAWGFLKISSALAVKKPGI